VEQTCPILLCRFLRFKAGCCRTCYVAAFTRTLRSVYLLFLWMLHYTCLFCLPAFSFWSKWVGSQGREMPTFSFLFCHLGDFCACISCILHFAFLSLPVPGCNIAAADLLFWEGFPCLPGFYWVGAGRNLLSSYFSQHHAVFYST
jgi:hypothetical protein